MAVTARRRPGLYQAACMLTDQVGDAVYIRAQANGAYKVAKCDPTTPAKMPAWGVIIQKVGFTSCVVQTEGEVRNIYTGLTPNKPYSVATNGRPIYPPQLTSGGMHQNLGVAIDVGVLYIRPADPVRLTAG